MNRRPAWKVAPVTGKPALLVARLSAQCPTENCALCGRFLALVDRLPVLGGYAHAACLLATAVRR